MPNQPTIGRRIAGVQAHYLAHPPHPRDAGDPRWINELPATRVILGWVGRGHRVLDLGCHEGDISTLIRAVGNEVTGIDLPELAAAARAKHGLDAVGHDLNRALPFGECEFDVVVSASVLDDLPDDLTHLLECYRVLRPGGRLIAVVPNDVSLFRRVQFLLGRTSRNFTVPTGYHTIHCYTLRGIKDLATVAGFAVAAHAKCPKRYSRLPLRYWIECVLPASFATDLAILAVRPPTGASGTMTAVGGPALSDESPEIDGPPT